MGYKLTWIYMRPNGVEKQIRPTWWQPWVNTIAYYPLNSTDTINDKSWNSRNLTNNWLTFWTYNWVDCANMTSNVYAYSTDIPLPSWANSRTISFWFYDTSRVNDTYWCAYGSHSTWNFFAPRINSSRYSFMGYARDFNTSTTVSTWVWKLITVTYDWATVKYYLNWSNIWSSDLSLNTTAVGSTRKFVIWCRLDSSANPNQYVKWYMSNMILEDKARTAQDVSDYYNLTKSNYWL